MNRKYFLAAAAAVVLIVACITRVLDGQNSIPTNSATPTPVSAFNGASSGNVFDPLRSLRAANTYAADGTSFPAAGALVAEKGARWSVVNVPAAGSEAVATKAAGASGVSHVADCVSFSAVATAAGSAAATAGLEILDGSTVIWENVAAFPIPAVGQQPIPVTTFCGLGLVGTAATSMTFEFTGSGVTDVIEAVTLSGYDVN